MTIVVAVVCCYVVLVCFIVVVVVVCCCCGVLLCCVGMFIVLFQTNITTFFTANICEKMSIQYTVLGFKPTAFGT